jgi:hypothetical protein
MIRIKTPASNAMIGCKVTKLISKSSFLFRTTDEKRSNHAEDVTVRLMNVPARRQVPTI